ncbi:MAG: hypothetical protein C4344_03405, partial [Acidimicrobiia bacterium]
GEHRVGSALVLEGDRLVVAVGATTRVNAEATGAVTLLWPGQPYSLILDGACEPVGEGELAVRPGRAVLHRVADADPALPSCVRILSGDRARPLYARKEPTRVRKGRVNTAAAALAVSVVWRPSDYT